MSGIVSTIVNGVPQAINNLVHSKIDSLPQLFSFAGSSADFYTVSGITGSFTTVSAATGTFGSISSSAYFNPQGNVLTQSNAFYAGSLSSTGASTALQYQTLVNRGFTVGTTGTNVNSVAIPAGSWTRVSYSIAVSTMPAASKLTATCVFNGVPLPDSTSYESNMPPTTGLGAINAVAQQTTLAGFSHFSAATGANLTISLACTSGTCVVSGGAIEIQTLV